MCLQSTPGLALSSAHQGQNTIGEHHSAYLSSFIFACLPCSERSSQAPQLNAEHRQELIEYLTYLAEVPFLSSPPFARLFPHFLTYCIFFLRHRSKQGSLTQRVASRLASSLNAKLIPHFHLSAYRLARWWALLWATRGPGACNVRVFRVSTVLLGLPYIPEFNAFPHISPSMLGYTQAGPRAKHG